MLKIAYHPIYNHNLPEGHRFPMEKYDLLPQQLVYEGTCNEKNFFTPEIPNNKYFFIVHDAEYVSDLMNLTLNQKAARKIGFPLNEDLITREKASLVKHMIQSDVKLMQKKQYLKPSDSRFDFEKYRHSQIHQPKILLAMN